MPLDRPFLHLFTANLRGSLTVAEFCDDLPFVPAPLFMVYDRTAVTLEITSQLSLFAFKRTRVNLMLEKLVPKLKCPVCLDSSAALNLNVFSRSEERRVLDGILVCEACSAWFPIEKYLLELIPAELMDIESAEVFAKRHSDDFRKSGVNPECAGRKKGAVSESSHDYSAHFAQREHFDWYAEKLDGNYADYAETPFWKVVDASTFDQWDPILNRSHWLLDVGCANGRSTFPLVDEKRVVVGFDISKLMIRQAIERAEKERCAERVSFFVGDGASLAFKDGSFDCVQTYGVLHHLPDPKKVIREIQRVLRPDGVHLGSENNDTAFRWIFDAVMRLFTIWHEEAGEEPLISHKMLADWTSGLEVKSEVSTSVFVLPHVFNLLGFSGAAKLLSLTDRIGKFLPWIKSNGGLIVFEITKSPSANAENPLKCLKRY